MSINFDEFINGDTVVLTGNIPDPREMTHCGTSGFSFVLTTKKLLYVRHTWLTALPLKNIESISMNPNTISIGKERIEYGPEKAELAKKLVNEIVKRIV